MDTIVLDLEDEKGNPSPIDFATAPATLSAGQEGRLEPELRAVACPNKIRARCAVPMLGPQLAAVSQTWASSGM